MQAYNDYNASSGHLNKNNSQYCISILHFTAADKRRHPRCCLCCWIINQWWQKGGLTLALTPSWTSGTLGMASYREDTYVMMDFSSGWGTSTSVQSNKNKKKPVMFQGNEKDGWSSWSSLATNLNTKSIYGTSEILKHKTTHSCNRSRFAAYKYQTINS